MRILQLHSDFIEYEPIKKEIPQAEEAEKKKKKYEDILVLFTTVEKGDDESVGRKAVDEVRAALQTLKVNKILIYPFAHLSSNLAEPEIALKVVKEMEDYAKKLRIETYRAPFGWNKALQIKVKGHPLAEQSKVISAEKAKEEIVSEALKAQEKMKSALFVLSLNGKLVPVEKFDFSKYPNLEKFAKYEMAKVRAVQQIPPHVTLMKRLEIADYEAGSDPGNLRWYPKGKLIKSLLEEFVTQEVTKYGAIEVETPIMYSFQHPSLANYLNRFPARQYVVKSEDKEFFLRFAACFGQFLMSKDAQISYKQLPFKIYELTRYSFRREKSGELVGLRRLRAFTMPDVHAMCADLEQVMKEFVIRFKLSMNILKELDLSKEDYELAIRLTRDFYEKNKKFVLSLVKLFGRPALIEIWPERFFYFILKWEFNFVDNLNKASALSTDQIDIENAKRYGITYVDKEGKRQYPVILHCSPSGAIERCIYAMLEKAYSEQQKGKVPKLPLWLSPVQVRLIPLSDKFLEQTERIASEIEKNCIRVDIDDRDETIDKKIRDAELEWIPAICVIGSKEIKKKTITVRLREEKKIEEMKIGKLIKLIRDKIKDKPFKPYSLPKYLTKRPIFVS
ncbi:MAG: threonine--tRNA ligase [Candidatus Aenigmarchaeota archaeon]|nr:threonine--tRNA ligase [Candidatus Aenigmarchaeota archaeon]